jgi:glycosyltransferase involved in cell wall biosynthesis
LAQQQKILFLYTEIAGYLLSSVNALIENYAVEVHIVRWPVQQEAPFEFADNSKIKLYQRQAYDNSGLLELAGQLDPDIIICSGWVDKGYLNVVSKFKGKIPTVLTLDNHWLGSAKQQVARVLSPFVLKSKFSHAWVPGTPQVAYAKKLGFKKISTGFYSADVTVFESYYNANREAKKAAFPHRFIYIGRYLDFKGIFDMWEAFLRLQGEQENDWEFWCLGTGDDYAKRVEHPKIKHFGFVQPSEIGQYIEQTGVFVLPSHKEPWAVTVHEFAAAGFPLICSDKVGAVDRFMDEGKNGYVHRAGNQEELFQAMKNMVNKTDEELLEMGAKSVALAHSITPKSWADTLMKMLN